MSSPGGYLLLAGGEPAAQAGFKRLLEQRGFSVWRAATLAEAWAVFEGEPPLALVLDICFFGEQGLVFLRELRKVSGVPVLVLSETGTPQALVDGLEAGGDDFLVKPCAPAVFIARLRALLRRAARIPETLTHGPITLYTASNKAYVNGIELGLQQKEFSLLMQFMQNPDVMLRTDALYKKVWGQEMHGDDNALKVAVSKLRTKLADLEYTIVASRGEGYCFERR
jgi:DNA-binding response OmpR family regulator